MKNNNTYRFLFAGGGTGGHLFPAIAVAEKILLLKPEADVLFVGSKNKIEGKVVPKLGFNFNSIWITGFARKFNFKNLLFPLKVFVSIIQSIIINMKFKPKVAIGSGGYVSGPAIWGASVLGAKVVLLEQNCFPGLTTRLLEKYADEIHINFEEAKKYFRSEHKIHLTGNPIRISINKKDKIESLKNFNFSGDKKTLLILGGSLGAKSINEEIQKKLTELNKNNLQIIWQTGSIYFENYKSLKNNLTYICPFIDDVSSAYSACDLLIARAGATTVAEITALGLPAILVPSPNVSDNHQYFNAKSLADINSAVLIKDENLSNDLLNTVLSLINDNEKLNQLSVNAKNLSKPDAANIIASHVIKIAEGN